MQRRYISGSARSKRSREWGPRGAAGICISAGPAREGEGVISVELQPQSQGPESPFHGGAGPAQPPGRFSPITPLCGVPTAVSLEGEFRGAQEHESDQESQLLFVQLLIYLRFSQLAVATAALADDLFPGVTDGQGPSLRHPDVTGHVPTWPSLCSGPVFRN